MSGRCIVCDGTDGRLEPIVVKMPDGAERDAAMCTACVAMTDRLRADALRDHSPSVLQVLTFVVVALALAFIFATILARAGIDPS